MAKSMKCPITTHGKERINVFRQGCLSWDGHILVHELVPGPFRSDIFCFCFLFVRIRIRNGHPSFSNFCRLGYLIYTAKTGSKSRIFALVASFCRILIKQSQISMVTRRTDREIDGETDKEHNLKYMICIRWRVNAHQFGQNDCLSSLSIILLSRASKWTTALKPIKKIHIEEMKRKW